MINNHLNKLISKRKRALLTQYTVISLATKRLCNRKNQMSVHVCVYIPVQNLMQYEGICNCLIKVIPYIYRYRLAFSHDESTLNR